MGWGKRGVRVHVNEDFKFFFCENARKKSGGGRGLGRGGWILEGRSGQISEVFVKIEKETRWG